MINRILSIFFPNRCPYCGELLSYPETECDSCRSQLYPQPMLFTVLSGSLCATAFIYEDPFRQAVLDMKFKGIKFNCESLGKVLTAACSELVTEFRPEIITSVPMSRDRLAIRGYNQSELLAKVAARELSLPYIRLLDRKNGARIQHELTMEQRLANHDLRFFLKEKEAIRGKTILLIDDIVTSGMTISECCRILEDGGAEKVICACIAAAGDHKAASLHKQ